MALPDQKGYKSNASCFLREFPPPFSFLEASLLRTKTESLQVQLLQSGCRHVVGGPISLCDVF